MGGMDRRRFLRATGVLATGAVLGESLLGCTPPIEGIGPEYFPDAVPSGSLLELPGREAPIDHVVVLMMENRSFDHYLGWLGQDGDYLQRGVARYRTPLLTSTDQSQSYLDPATGELVDTFHLPSGPLPDPWRGCGYNDPGHGWTHGLAQRDGGFLAPGSGNDVFALGHYRGDDLPFTSRLARRFTTFDRYFCSALTSTQTNRRYLHSAQSAGYRHNYVPIAEGGFAFDTIWDRLRAAGVPIASYFADLPSLAFWGFRLSDTWAPIDRYFEDCEAGRLPAVTFLDPPYLPWWQADDHPHADPRAGQRFLRDVFRAFARSSHWERGLFVLTYDEWGGFFDHVRPPLLPDDRAGLGADGFDHAQAGFRVPTILASPYARPGYVDHRTYDHTSIMRFLEWRFLGALPEGPGTGSAPWALSVRDRHANNIGASLGASGADPGLFDLDDLLLGAPLPNLCSSDTFIYPPGTQPNRPLPWQTTTSAPPAPVRAAATPASPPVARPEEPHGPAADLLEAYELGFFDRIGARIEPSPMAGTWASGD